MEARVDIGEMDVVLIAPGQIARLEVDAYRDRKFTGIVSEIANSAKGTGTAALTASSSGQDATKFEVHIRITEKEILRPGMSVTAEIETRYRTNVLVVPIASVTTRLPKEKKENDKGVLEVKARTNAPAPGAKTDKKSKEAAKPVEVVFLADGERAKMVPVKIGISDDSYWEITEGVQEGQDVISGGYRAISKDLEDGKKIVKGLPASEAEKK
jgi:HlyD family secretion protein